MAYQALWQDTLPWSDNEADRKLVGFVFVALVVSTILFLIVQFLPLLETEQRELEEVAPRLAKLIIEKQAQPKPPPPVPQPKPEEPKPKAEEKPKPEPKPKAEPKPKPQPDRTEVAKKQAQQHITQIQDALADLREFDTSALDRNKPVQTTGKAATNQDNTTAVIASRATQGSGGINTSRLSRDTGDSKLQGRQTTAVTSSLDTGSNAARGTRSGGSGAASRPYAEIELVFQKNKGGIFSLYSRALRQDPTLQGKVVLELTIAPSGEVTNVRIVSSELNNAELESKLIARVRLFRFEAKNVGTLIVKYPIDFLPS